MSAVLTAPFPPTTIIPQRLSPRRPLTCADVAALPESLPSGDVRYELDNGELIVMPPPGDMHGAIQLNLGTELKLQGERRGLGKARSEVGVILWRDPDRLVGADAAFIAQKSLPLKVSSEGYLETIPDLVVEVRSKNDTLEELENKVRDYLTAGVRVVWVVDAVSRTVTASRPGAPPRVWTDDETLTVEDIIPGFRVDIADLLRT